MQHFTFWVQLYISHIFQYNWEFPYFLKPTNEKLFIRNSKFLSEIPKKQNSSDFLNLESKDLNLAHHFHLSSVFLTLEFSVNLYFWQTFRSFFICGFKAWFRANNLKHVSKFECLDLIFWRFFFLNFTDFILVFQNTNLVWDDLNFKFSREFVLFFNFVWNLPLFSLFEFFTILN